MIKKKSNTPPVKLKKKYKKYPKPKSADIIDDFVSELEQQDDTCFTNEELYPKAKKPVNTQPDSELYVDKAELVSNIKKYYDTGVVSRELGEQIYNIATKLSFKYNFIYYTYREEMVSDALEKMMQAVYHKKYKLRHGTDGNDTSAFTYFTTIAFRAMVNRIKIEQKNSGTIKEYTEAIYNELGQTHLIDGSSVYVKPSHDNNNDESAM